MTVAGAPTRAESEPLVEMRGVSKRWDASSGLAAIDATLHAGEIVALQGRSGSGKSTMLALLAGWCEPDGGTITRRASLAAGDAWRTWSGTAIVPQVLGLVGELSVRENVALVLRLAGVARPDVDSRVAAMIERLDLGEQAGRLPREISLGQQQRLAVARAAIGRPMLLLADEPTCHQDLDHASAVLAELRSVAERDGAVLVASHDDVVASWADRVISLDG